MATTNAQTFTIGGVAHQVEDVGARQLIADLQAALNAITSGDTTTAIKTFNEIIAFLDNIEDSSTLQGIIAGLNTAIAAKADKSEMAVADNNNGTVTITLKTGTSATVLTQHQSLAGYALSSSLAAVATSGSYNDLSNKPTIPTKVSDLTNDSGFITNTDTPLVVVSTTGDVTQALDSGKWYRFGTIDSLTLTLNAVTSGCVGTYFGRFTASSNWTDIAVPNGVTAATSNDTIEGGKTYEFSIVDGIIKINEV